MKKSILYLSFLAGVSWIIFTSSSGGRAAVASADNTVAGCTCHNSGNFSPSIAMELLDGSTPVTEYIPGNSYTFSVTVSGDGSQSGFGMQSKALAGAAQAGDFTFALTSNSQISSIGAIEYPEQNGYSTTGVFQYTWVAPVSSTGDVVFYAAGNAVNGAAGSVGDGMATPIDMTITETVASVCSAPTNLTVTNISATSAEINWVTNSGFLNEVVVVPTGNTPPGNSIVTTQNPYVYSGLTPGTTYDSYVRSICNSPVIITGAFDGPLTGGIPKAIELYGIEDVQNLSNFGLSKITNGGGPSGSPSTMLPNEGLGQGQFYYVSSDSASFRDYFGFDADYVWGGLSINGDDAVELFAEDSVIDVFGQRYIDGTGTSWDHLDGWAYRNDNTYSTDTVFTVSDWTFSGTNATDGCSDNSSCGSVWPIGTFTSSSNTSNVTGPITFTTPCVTITLNETVNDISCSGNSDGNISLAPSGGGTSYSYLWGGGQVTSSISGLAQGTYDVTVTYGSCTMTQSFNINEPTALSVNPLQSNLSCNGSSTGTLIVMGVGGPTTNYTYDWSDGSTDVIRTGLNAGTYDLTVTSGICEVVESYTLTEPTAISITSMGNTSVSCNGGNDGGYSVAVTGGPVSTYSYAWSNGSTLSMATGLAGGVDIVTVTSGGCVETMSYTISEPSLFSLAVTVTDATTGGGTDGTATAVVGVASNYTYVWNNAGQITQTATGFGAGTATVTVTQTGGNNCSQVASGVVADPTSCNITLTTAGNNPICFGGTDGFATVSAVGGPSTLYSYSWSSGASLTMASGLAAGPHAVTVSSGSCTATDAITLTEPLQITSTDAVDLCSGDSVLLGGVYVNSGGMYIDTQSAMNGCDSIVSVSVTVVSGPFAGVDGQLDYCVSSFLEDVADGLDPGATTGGDWYDDNGAPLFLNITNISPATLGVDTLVYSYKVDDGLGTGCSIDSSLITVVIHPAPNAGGSSTTSACVSAGVVNLAQELSSPDFGGIWDDLDASGALTDSLFDVSMVSVGDYLVSYSVMGNAGCDADTAFITVQILSNPDAGVGGTLEACDDDFLQTLDPADGLSGTPDGGGTWNDDDGSGAFFIGMFSPATAGPGDWNFTYTVSATGCTDVSSTVTITVNGAVDAGSDGADTVCATNTSVNVSSLLGGTPNAGGTWSDDNASGALTGTTFDPSLAGVGVYDFTYTVTGEGSCADATATVEITVDACASINEISEVQNVQLYPNPNNGEFVIELMNWDLKSATVDVLSTDGRVVYSGTINSYKEQIDMDDVSTGIYFVAIQNSENTIVKKITIQ